ncbi:MAG: hypothetical protein M1839_001236 [Geoglossum umbratile]|nr:MAG: hypothetical protein M1839_001236 [Geoglossum umbratile]
MSHNHTRRFYVNPAARSWRCTSTVDPRIGDFHQRLPSFAPTPLVSLDSVATELGVKRVFVKDESSRMGLPAFKILGASWATYRAVVRTVGLTIGVSLEDLSVAAQKARITLFTATDGNHGRAVARMAKLLGIKASVFVPLCLDRATRDLIAGEGAQVTAAKGDYDFAVRQARTEAETAGGILIQDTAFPGYEEIPQWIVDGYSTMMSEVTEQVFAATGSFADLAVVPVGVGSLAQSAVIHYKSAPRPSALLAVEPESAACLRESLFNGAPTAISTGYTIMSGMNCGTVSSIAWPVLVKGTDASISVSEVEAHDAVQRLRLMGVNSGPCGAATLAALRVVARNDPEAVGLNANSIVVLFCTEGVREYDDPTVVATSSRE